MSTRPVENLTVSPFMQKPHLARHVPRATPWHGMCYTIPPPMTSEQTTDVALPQGDPATPQPGRLEQQNISGAWIDNKYEVWANGIFRRKVFTVSADEGPVPVPNLNEDAPIAHVAKRLQRIAGRPAYISAIGHRIDDDREIIGLTFLQGTDPEDLDSKPQENLAGPKWVTLWATHGQISDQKRLLMLADDVFPVRSSNAKEVSDFLTDCYDCNTGFTNKSTIVRRVGYHNVNGAHGWLVGKYWIGSGKVTADPYKDKLSRAIGVKGSEEEWVRYTRQVWEHDSQSWIVRWFLATSFGSPLLRLIGERTFIVHHYAQSGGAKTTIANLCQSAWGHPKEFGLSMNRNTKNSATEIFKYISDLPVLFDEIQGREHNLAEWAMQLCTEEHKQRTKQEGMLQDVVSSWYRLIVRTTGEEPIAGTDKADPGGQRNRMLECGHPGLAWDHSIEVWNWLGKFEHYGHAGIRFLRNLLAVWNDPARYQNLNDRFREYMKMIQHFSKNDKPSFRDRQLAAIMLAEVLMLQWIYGMTAEESGKIALKDAAEVNKNWLRVGDGPNSVWARAAEFLVQHRSQSANLYADATDQLGLEKIKTFGSRTSQPLVGVLNAGARGDEIWYFKDSTDKLLKEKFQIDPDRIWEEFAREGILDRGKDRLTKSRQIVHFMGATQVCVVSQEALLNKRPAEPTPVDEKEIEALMPASDDDWFGTAEDEESMYGSQTPPA